MNLGKTLSAQLLEFVPQFSFARSVARDEAKKSIYPQITQIKTNHYCNSVTHLSSDTAAVDNRMKICVNLRNLRAELRF